MPTNVYLTTSTTAGPVDLKLVPLGPTTVYDDHFHLDVASVGRIKQDVFVMSVDRGGHLHAGDAVGVVELQLSIAGVFETALQIMLNNRSNPVRDDLYWTWRAPTATGDGQWTEEHVEESFRYDAPPGYVSLTARGQKTLGFDDIYVKLETGPKVFHRLSFHMQQQQQGNWCWAAVSTSIAQFFDPSTPWTQCTVADAELQRTDCCGTGGPGPCNVYGMLHTALTLVGHFDHMTAAPAGLEAAADEIDGGRPLGVRVSWSGGGAHFLALVGYRDFEAGWVAVDDPTYGPSDMPYSTLVSGYKGSGTWTHSYYTKT